jgi:hypothetical protein
MVERRLRPLVKALGVKEGGYSSRAGEPRLMAV